MLGEPLVNKLIKKILKFTITTWHLRFLKQSCDKIKSHSSQAVKFLIISSEIFKPKRWRMLTGTGSGLLGGIPRVVVQISALTKRATVGVRAPYATKRKLQYEANQVCMNTTFISQGPQSSGILAVET